MKAGLVLGMNLEDGRNKLDGGISNEDAFKKWRRKVTSERSKKKNEELDWTYSENECIFFLSIQILVFEGSVERQKNRGRRKLVKALLADINARFHVEPQARYMQMVVVSGTYHMVQHLMVMILIQWNETYVELHKYFSILDTSVSTEQLQMDTLFTQHICLNKVQTLRAGCN